MDERRILLVEDDPDDRQLALSAFDRCDLQYPVDIATDGAEALDYLRRAKRLPALVVLDLKLPKIGGLEVLERLRADRRLERQLVVVLTGSDEPRDVNKARQLGVAKYFQKPIGPDGFVEIVHELKTLLGPQQPRRP